MQLSSSILLVMLSAYMRSADEQYIEESLFNGGNLILIFITSKFSSSEKIVDCLMVRHLQLKILLFFNFYSCFVDDDDDDVCLL